MIVKIFIGGLAFELNEMALAELVSPYGEISTMKIVRNKQTGIGKGYAFLEMESEEDANQVIAALHGQTHDGRQLSVTLKEEPVTAPPPPARYQKIPRPGEPPVKKKRPRRPLG